MQAGTRTAHGIADGSDGLVLSDDTLVKLFLQVQQLLALALHHAGHGDARPAAHHFGNVVGSDGSLQPSPGGGFQLRLQFVEPCFLLL